MRISTIPAGSATPRLMRSTLELALATAAWVATIAVAKFAPGAWWQPSSPATVVTIVASVLVGVGMLVAHTRHLRAMDELQRTIQLHAMGWALGVGVVAGIAWTLLEHHRVIAMDATIADVVIVMALVYLATVLLGARRYR